MKTSAKSPARVFALCVLFCLAAASLPATDTGITVSTSREKNTLITDGRVDATGWYDEGVRVVTDWANYSQWALQGIDGKDPVSAQYWEQFRTWIFKKPDTLTLVYDINLGWPFGSKGNKAVFKIDDTQVAKGRLRLTMPSTPFLVRSITLELFLEHSADGQKDYVRFRLSIGLEQIVVDLIKQSDYSDHMNAVVSRIITNLKAYVLARTAQK